MCVYIIKKTCIYICVYVCGIVLINILVPQFGPLNKNSWLCPCIHGHSNSSDGALPTQDKTNKQSCYYSSILSFTNVRSLFFKKK